jgi:hypothetical protein
MSVIYNRNRHMKAIAMLTKLVASIAFFCMSTTLLICNACITFVIVQDNLRQAKGVSTEGVIDIRSKSERIVAALFYAGNWIFRTEASHFRLVTWDSRANSFWSFF